MNAQDVLKSQFHFFYMTLRSNLEGLTAEHSVRQPTPGGNCANWIVGHLVSAHNGIMGLAGTEPVWESEALDRDWPVPITSADEALDWDTMVERLLASEERLMAALDALTDEELDEGGFTDPFGHETTRGAFLSLMAFHQTYHAGQLGMSRRLVGLPGVIGAPPKPAATA